MLCSCGNTIQVHFPLDSNERPYSTYSTYLTLSIQLQFIVSKQRWYCLLKSSLRFTYRNFVTLKFVLEFFIVENWYRVQWSELTKLMQDFFQNIYRIYLFDKCSFSIALNMKKCMFCKSFNCFVFRSQCTMLDLCGEVKLSIENFCPNCGILN